MNFNKTHNRIVRRKEPMETVRVKLDDFLLKPLILVFENVSALGHADR
jgi:hypothetical protein